MAREPVTPTKADEETGATETDAAATRDESDLAAVEAPPPDDPLGDATEGADPADDTPDADADPGPETGDAPEEADPIEVETSDQTPVAATAGTAEAVAPPSRGGSVLPLVLGGLIAGGIGFGASYVWFGQGGTEIDQLSATLAAQGDDIARLADENAALRAALDAAAADQVDLTPLESATAALMSQSEDFTAAMAGTSARLDDLDGALDVLTDRVVTLEARPIFTGEGGDAEATAAAMAAVTAELRAELGAQQEANEAMAEEIRALAASAEGQITEAEARMAEVEARAEERVAGAAAQAALGELRIAAAAGTPFADALSDVSAATGTAIPDALAYVAETGIPTLEDLQARFPAAARAALPVALRETAGEGAMDRLGAFLRGQVGGRSLEPRDGDDPDAILSRAEAALTADDIETTLAEIEMLPEAAQAAFGDWTALAMSRAEALAAFDGFAAALAGVE